MTTLAPDPTAAPQQPRLVEGILFAAWCPTCEQEAMPLTTGRCGWCDTPISVRLDRDGRPTTIPPENTPGLNRCERARLVRLLEPDATPREIAARTNLTINGAYTALSHRKRTRRR